MDRTVTPAIAAVERLSDGVMVKFTDGTCVFYSATLLYATKLQAEPQNENALAW